MDAMGAVSMNKEFFDLTVDIEGQAKLAGIQAKYGREKLAKKTLNGIYTRLLLMYENGTIPK